MKNGRPCRDEYSKSSRCTADRVHLSQDHRLNPCSGFLFLPFDFSIVSSDSYLFCFVLFLRKKKTERWSAQFPPLKSASSNRAWGRVRSTRCPSVWSRTTPRDHRRSNESQPVSLDSIHCYSQQSMLHGECGDFGVDLVSTIKVSRLTWSWLLKALLSLEFPAFKISVLTWSQAIKVSLLVSQVFLLLP